MLPRVYDTSGMVPAPAPSTHEKGAVRAKTVEYGRVALRAAVHFAVRVYISQSLAWQLGLSPNPTTRASSSGSCHNRCHSSSYRCFLPSAVPRALRLSHSKETRPAPPTTVGLTWHTNRRIEASTSAVARSCQAIPRRWSQHRCRYNTPCCLDSPA